MSRSVGGVDGWTVCMHAGEVQATTASLVARLDTDPPTGWWCAGWPCRSAYVPMAVGPVGEPVAWERFAALAPGHRPVLDARESTLAADFAGSAGWPYEAWRRVDETLCPLENSGNRVQ